VTHRGVEVQGVAVSSSDSSTADVAGVDQVSDDSLGCSLGDADALGEVTEAGVWLRFRQRRTWVWL
jgi:hypothetical protein